MNDGDRRRVELILPMRTVLLVAASLGVLAAFRAIGDTFLIVFVGIFLGLVFEYPVRFVHGEDPHVPRARRDRDRARHRPRSSCCSRCCCSCRSSGACATSCTTFRRRCRACATPASSTPSAAPAPPRTCSRAPTQVSASVPDAISAVLGIAGDFFGIFLAAFTILFICLFLLTDVGNLKRSLGSVLMPGEDERWLGVWERITASISRWAIGVDRDRGDRRHDPGRHRLAARLELCDRRSA